MRGYYLYDDPGVLHPPRSAAGHGWYDTGDIAAVDPSGFLHILGRLKRFAKVSGEMVSLTAVEDALAGAFPHYGMRCQIAVITRPDEEKGEVLIAVANEPRLQLAEIRAVIKAKGLNNLSVPREILVPEEPEDREVDGSLRPLGWRSRALGSFGNVAVLWFERSP